jgi:hypothetical protein
MGILRSELGVDQVVAEDKEHNGKVEVFNANPHKELFHRGHPRGDERKPGRRHMRSRTCSSINWRTTRSVSVQSGPEPGSRRYLAENQLQVAEGTAETRGMISTRNVSCRRGQLIM